MNDAAIGHGGRAGPAVAPTPTLHAEIAALLHDFSIEVTPGEVARLGSPPADLPAASRVYITSIAGKPFDATLRAAVRLREWGMQPVPHLVARGIADPSALDDMLAALRREAAVDHALLIAGSARTPLGSFDASLPALRTGSFERHGWRGLGVAGHPEGSPELTPEVLAQALKAKSDYARSSTLRIHVITQFCFDATPLLGWERGLRAAGIGLPVTAGLAGLASLPTLIRYARICGVGASLGVLTRQAGRLLRLSAAVTPGALVTAIAAARRADPGGSFAGVHFFPFGSLEATVAWAAAVARGDFKLIRGESDIEV